MRSVTFFLLIKVKGESSVNNFKAILRFQDATVKN